MTLPKSGRQRLVLHFVADGKEMATGNVVQRAQRVVDAVDLPGTADRHFPNQGGSGSYFTSLPMAKKWPPAMWCSERSESSTPSTFQGLRTDTSQIRAAAARTSLRCRWQRNGHRQCGAASAASRRRRRPSRDCGPTLPKSGLQRLVLHFVADGKEMATGDVVQRAQRVVDAVDLPGTAERHFPNQGCSGSYFTSLPMAKKWPPAMWCSERSESSTPSTFQGLRTDTSQIRAAAARTSLRCRWQRNGHRRCGAASAASRRRRRPSRDCGTTLPKSGLQRLVLHFVADGKEMATGD